MDHPRTTVRLGNPRDPSLPALTEQAVVDLDAMHLRIPWRGRFLVCFLELMVQVYAVCVAECRGGE